ncbi:hypothetical protein U9M48_041152 [Paspalum notatum var. saurae]|uniref:Uncharacterized protein n=1 Tax=Paspalum notatum var. saurae TaxID=547442 RepID=A0AAQ3XDW7_PASNO
MTLELKPSNFTKWSTAFRATCGKFGLLHHLATASTSNSDEAWLQADFCVRGWMYSTVSDAVLNLAMTDDKQTASALWAAIGAVFQANKAPRAIFLNHEFHSMTQGDLSIDAYCVRMKEKADELRDVGQPVSEPNLVLNLLRGLNECAPPPPSWLLPPLMAVTNSSSCRAAGVLTPSRLASSPSHTPPAATNAFPGASIPGPANVWHLESASPLPGQRRRGGSGAPGGPGAQAGRNPGILGPPPQANTAFAPLQTSSSGSNTWDATGLIAALQDMQQQGDWIVDSGASTHMTSSAATGTSTPCLPPQLPLHLMLSWLLRPLCGINPPKLFLHDGTTEVVDDTEILDFDAFESNQYSTVPVSFSSQAIPTESGVDIYHVSQRPPGNSFTILTTFVVVVVGCDLDVLLKHNDTGSHSFICTVACPSKEAAEMVYMQDCEGGGGCCYLASYTPVQALEFQFLRHGGKSENFSNLGILWDRINITVSTHLVWSIVDQTRCPSSNMEETRRSSSACISENSEIV